MGLACTRPDTDNLINFPQKVLLLGHSSAGKTSLLYGWKLGCDALVKPLPTEDFNVEQLKYNGRMFIVWDLSGAPNYQGRWRQFYHGTNVLVIVVDSSDEDKVSNVKTHVDNILRERDLNNIPCLIVFNKSDITDHNIEALQKTWDLPDSHIAVTYCCARDNQSCNAVLHKICSMSQHCESIH